MTPNSFAALCHRLADSYEPGEARAVMRLLLEDGFGLSLADVLCGATERLSEQEQQCLQTMMQRLEQGEPVQYVLGQAWFCGRRFRVAPGVLIPRPETEELCRLVETDVAEGVAPRGARVLDVGTGSGCIACTLAAQLSDAKVSAWDVSPQALAIAAENVSLLGVAVQLAQHDILAEADSRSQPHRPWDAIVSNPPYVCQSERAAMLPQVASHEPALALFVPDHDPLLFYRAIARYALRTLSPQGRVYVEINERLGASTRSLLLQAGFKEARLFTDQFGKERFIRACK